jgi:hypothetical protein
MRFDAVKAPELAEVVGILAEVRDAGRIETGRRRMEAISRGQCPDYLPLSFNRRVDRGGLPVHSMRDQFYNRECMLVEQLWGAIAQAASGSDVQPTIRPQLGVGFTATLVGIESIIVNDDTMPWPHGHLSIDEIERLQLPDDLRQTAGMRRALELLAFYRETVGQLCEIYIPDTQGPFDVAHLIRGNDILSDLYERPDFVRRLMEVATRIWVDTVKICKESIQESPGVCYHSGRFLAVGNRACFDTDTLIGAEHLAEFVEPYVRRAAEAVGGIWAHYCGRNPHLANMLIAEIDAVRGLNLGNPSMHDPLEYLADCRANGKFFTGPWREGPQELEEYLRRILGALGGRRSGLAFEIHSPKGSDAGWAERTMALWHRLQDELLERP